MCEGGKRKGLIHDELEIEFSLDVGKGSSSARLRA